MRQNRSKVIFVVNLNSNPYIELTGSIDKVKLKEQTHFHSQII